jgi:aminopeptidase
MINSVNSPFQPPKEVLEKYAELLVDFALGPDEGIQPGEVVQCLVPDVAKPLALELQNAVLKAGGHPVIRMLPTGFDRDFYQLATDEQLKFFPAPYMRERLNLLDHSIGIIADVDPFELREVPPEKIITSRDAKKDYREWMIDKETAGHFTWTLALWGVEAKAELVGLTLDAYWQQIISACFLDQPDPIAVWRSVKTKQQKTRDALNKLHIDYLKITGKDVNLTVKLGSNRIWKGGADRNIPSFELFTSPDWRGTEGWVQFNQPVYRYGNLLDGVRLELHDGIVTKATAEKGQALLDQMLTSRNANKIGEFSLTDSRLSRITHTMAETLYDENIGGRFGNMHLAIGSAYRDCYRADPKEVTREEWEEMGFNDSPEHTDIVSTTDRTVEATLTDGSTLIIYKDGKFTL